MSAVSASPMPAPTSSCGASVHAQPARGSTRKRGKPSGDEDDTGCHRHRPSRRDGREPAGDDRREWQHADHEPGRCRRHAPAGDEQEHDEEERGDEAAGEEEQRGVRRQVRPPGTPRNRLSGQAADGCERQQGEWHLDEEDRLPAEPLGEHPAGRGPERGSEDSGGDPHPDGAGSLVSTEGRAPPRRAARRRPPGRSGRRGAPRTRARAHRRARRPRRRVCRGRTSPAAGAARRTRPAGRRPRARD